MTHKKVASSKITESLKLLNEYTKKRDPKLKENAIKQLSQLSDHVLQVYLLQLIQALRYDFDFDENSKDSTDDFLKITIGPLGQFLIDRAIKNNIFASYFHWYIRVEVQVSNESDKENEFFQLVYNRFLKELKRSKNGSQIARELRLQGEFVSKILKIMYRVSMIQDKSIKTDKLREYLKDLEIKEPVPLLLDPTKHIVSIKKDNAKIFFSSNRPAIIEFILDDKDNDKKIDINKPSYKVLIKSEDLRQDQLCISMIHMMNRLFLKNNLDLNLIYYKVIATSSRDGFVEYVQGSFSLSKILKEYSDIRVFFKKYNSDVDKFIKSCAGYTIMTYILGIGDRHLDNIMVKTSGELFHIDFGYMFGRDPKPFKAEMRITKEMIVGMGGPKSSGFFKFRNYCWKAFQILRKNYFRIMNMLKIMTDSNIPDLSVNQESSAAIQYISKRFQVQMTDDKAEMWLYETINQSANALGPIIMEFFHRKFSISE